MGFTKLFASMLALSALGACGNFNISSDCDCGYYTSNAGKMIHWKDGSKIKFVVHQDMPQAHRMALLAVQQNYANTLASTSITIDTTSNTAPSLKNGKPDSVSGDGINGIYYISGSWPFFEADGSVSDSDAMTVIQADGGGMKEADIFFRAPSFELSEAAAAIKTMSTQQALTWVVNSAPENAQWLYKVGNHEMGHALGLIHTDEHSIMTPKVSLDPLDHVFSDRDLLTFGKAYQVRSPSGT